MSGHEIRDGKEVYVHDVKKDWCLVNGQIKTLIFHDKTAIIRDTENPDVAHVIVVGGKLSSLVTSNG